MNKYKVGDKVFDIRHGWGTVEAIYEDSHYPLWVEFPLKTPYKRDWYTLDGKDSEDHRFPCLLTVRETKRYVILDAEE